MIWISGVFVFLVFYVTLRLMISDFEFPDIDDIGTWEEYECIQPLPKKLGA